MKSKLLSTRPLRSGAALVAVVLVALAGYATREMLADATSQGNCTQKINSTNAGCSCHCPTASNATSVAVTTQFSGTYYTGDSYTFTVTVTNTTPVETAAGIDIATQTGQLTPGAGMQTFSGNGTELVQNSPQTLSSSGVATWTFTYSPTQAGPDTIFATGLAANNDASTNNGLCVDQWNNAAKFVIQAVKTTRRMTVSRSAINLGRVRLGFTNSDTLLVASTGNHSDTITQSGLQNGAPFRYGPPHAAPRVLPAAGSPGSTEVDTVFLHPTAHGTFSDSLVLLDNSDTVADRRFSVFVTGQGVQAKFQLTVDSIDFGEVALGQSGTYTYYYSNVGDDTLYVAPSTTGSAEFSVTQGPKFSAGLPPGQQDHVVVQFAPTAVGLVTGALIFNASYGIKTPTIPLTGKGYDPNSRVGFDSPQALFHVRVGTTENLILRYNSIGSDSLHIWNVKLTQPKTKKWVLLGYDTAVAGLSSGKVRVQYSPTTEGIDTATLTFNTDDHWMPQVTILFFSEGIVPHMALGRHDTIDMGTIEPHQRTIHRIVIQDTGSDDLQILDASAKPSPFGIDPFAGVFVPAHLQDYLTVSFAPDSLGIFKGMFFVTSDDPSRPSDSIPLKGRTITSLLKISNPSVDFGLVPVGTTVYDTVYLANAGSSPVQIVSDTLLEDSIVFAIVDSIAVKILSNDSVRVIISFTPTSPTAFSGTVQLTTDDENARIRTISLSGVGARGSLAITPNPLIFGIVEIQHDTTLKATLKNNGNGPVTISALTLTSIDSAFSMPSVTLPDTLRAGDSLVVTITFTPKRPIVDTGTLLATLADGTSLSASVAGIGAVPPPPPPPPESVGGTSQAAALTLTVMPNPATSVATVLLGGFGDEAADYTLYNLLGHELLHGRATQTLQLDLSGLPEGVYYLRVASGGRSASTKIVVSR